MSDDKPRMSDDKPRYGRRRIDRMLKEWQALREAVAQGDPKATQAAFDACEEWVDFAFGATTTERNNNETL